MATKRFSRSTKGLNAEVIVAKAINITTDATLALFLANAPLGEVGVYDGNDALHTDAITATETFYFVVRTTEGIYRTKPYLKSQVTAYKKAYVAPVKQISGIGWYGAGGSLNALPIEAGQIYAIIIKETTEGYDPYPTWYFDHVVRTSDAQIDVMQELARKINDDASLENNQNQRLVTAKVKADATYGNYAATTGSTFTLVATNGSKELTYTGTTPTYDVAANDYISFDAAAAPTDNIGDIYKVAAVSATGFTLNRAYTGATQAFTEAESEGTRIKKVTVFQTNLVGLSITTIDNDVHFRLAKQEDLKDADITYVTAYTKGNGTYTNVSALEKEGHTFAGETTQNVAFKEKYGQMDNFSVVDETYDYYHIKGIKTENGIAPEAVHTERSYIIIPVAKSTGNVDSTLDTLFGL